MSSVKMLGWTSVLSYLALVSLGCREKPCIPGETQACLCAGAVSGAQVCSSEGDRWGECMCSLAGPSNPSEPRSKISQCNDLIEVVNKGVQGLEKGQKSGSDPTGLSDLKSMADAMDKVALDAAAVQLTDPKLRKFSTEYQTVVKEVAKAARDMAAAAQAKDPEKIKAAQEAMERAVKQEDPLVDGLNKFCQTP